jgi:hypothetical protein
MFEIGFGVEVDPEFPAGGGEPAERIPAGLPRVGAILRITAPGHPSWDIAIGAPNWWRTPIPTAIAFISDRAGFVADVVERRVITELSPVTRIWEAEESDLLLMVSFSEITAIGADGVAWVTDRLAWDDLKVVHSDTARIVCRGFITLSDIGTMLSEITLDPRTGRQLTGAVFDGV